MRIDIPFRRGRYLGEVGIGYISLEGLNVCYTEPFGEKRKHVLATINNDGTLKENMQIESSSQSRVLNSITCTCNVCQRYVGRVIEKRAKYSIDELRSVARNFEINAIESECYHIHRREVLEQLERILNP